MPVYSTSPNLVEVPAKDLAAWEDISMPDFDYAKHPSADSFSYSFAVGTYLMTYDYIYAVLDGDQSWLETFFASYDGWNLGIYAAADTYNWSYRGSESFGLCVDNYCAGFWAEYSLTSGTASYDFKPIQFYYSDPSVNAPVVPNQYDSGYYENNVSFSYAADASGDFGSMFPGNTFFWILLPNDNSLFDPYGEADVVSFTSIAESGANSAARSVKLIQDTGSGLAATATILLTLGCAVAL
jgi:hypothetical protein